MPPEPVCPYGFRAIEIGANHPQSVGASLVNARLVGTVSYQHHGAVRLVFPRESANHRHSVVVDVHNCSH